MLETFVYTLILTISCTVTFALLIYIYIRKYSSTPIRILVLILLTLILVNVSDIILIYNTDATIYETLNAISYACFAITPTLYLWFVFSYIGKEDLIKKLWFWAVTIIPSILIIYFIWNTKLFMSLRFEDAVFVGFRYEVTLTSIGSILLSLYPSIFYMTAIFVLVHFYFNTNDEYKRVRVKYMVLAPLVPIFGDAIFVILLPVLFHATPIPVAGSIFSVTALILLLSIMKFGSSAIGLVTVASKIIDTMGEAVIAISNSGSIEFVNKISENLLDIPINEVKEKPFKSIFKLEPEYEYINKNIDNFPVDNSEINIIKEAEFTTSKNRKLFVSISITRVLYEDQKVAGYILVLNDISKTKQYIEQIEKTDIELKETNNTLVLLQQKLEEEKSLVKQKVLERTADLQNEHARLIASLNSSLIGFIITDFDGNFVIVNKSAKVILNLNDEDNSLISIDNKIENLEIKSRTMQMYSQNTSTLIPNIDFNGKNLKFFLSPISIDDNSENKFIGSVIIIEDETEDKIIERSREEFFTIASHELRTPLTAIKGYISLFKEMYLQEMKSNEAKTIIGYVDSSSDRLVEMVNDFLDSSKLEQGRMNLIFKDCNIVDIVKNVIEETRSLPNAKKLYLKLDKDYSDIPAVLGDESKIKQIIINLIGNAVKFTENGGITVSLQLINDYVKVLVSDTGKGISDQNKNLLFRKFQQAGESIYTRDATGTGLGLYISKMLIEKMHGEIHLEESIQDKGSTFSFTIPIFKVK